LEDIPSALKKNVSDRIQNKDKKAKGHDDKPSKFLEDMNKAKAKR
jgi:hypothetical protein